MNEGVTFTGGAHLGWVQATWPFGRLSVSPGQLTISLPFVGRYTFTRSDVSGLERCGIASNGVRIFHTRSDCPETVIFWCGRSRVPRVLEVAAQAGFPGESRPSTERRGMPLRWIAIALLQLIAGFLFAALTLQMLF